MITTYVNIVFIIQNSNNSCILFLPFSNSLITDSYFLNKFEYREGIAEGEKNDH